MLRGDAAIAAGRRRPSGASGGRVVRLASLPRSRVGAGAMTPTLDNAPLVEVDNVVKTFHVGGGLLRQGVAVPAVRGVSFTIREGETLGLVGESGSGKSTVGRMLLRLEDPTAGTMRFAGHDLIQIRPRAMRELRRQMQVIFQDPYASLNPRMRVGDYVEEPLIIHGI